MDALFVFALSLFCYSWQLGQSQLAGTEGHRALTAHQMVQTGQYLLPHLYDQLYLKKPPLDYWIVAGFELLTGQANEWLWRFPSALAAAILAAVLCIASNRWFGKPAGLVAGLSHLALLAVWEQSRTADIDSMNSLFSVLAALGLIHLVVRPKSWFLCLMAGLAIGGSLMVKGPAGFTVIAGALIGPAITNRRIKLLQRFRPWLALAIGLALFAAYALAAWHRCQVEHIRPDLSGLSEAADKAVHITSPIFILEAVTLPFVLFLYSLPVSAALLLCFLKPIWNDHDQDRRLITRSIIGSLLVGSIVAILSGMINPRYGYVMLPLLCPLAGAVAACAARGELPIRARHFASIVLDITAIAFVGLAVAITSLGWNSITRADRVFTLTATAFALEALWIYLARKRPLALVALVVLLAIPLTAYFNQDRYKRSSYPAAMELARLLPPGTLITTGQIAMNQPELFYYAKMKVESHPTDFATPLALPSSRWIILTREEYAAWSTSPQKVLSRVTRLWPQRDNAFLAWYDATAMK